MKIFLEALTSCKTKKDAKKFLKKEMYALRCLHPEFDNRGAMALIKSNFEAMLRYCDENIKRHVTELFGLGG